MNSLAPWNPFKEMDDLQTRLAKVFGLTRLVSAEILAKLYYYENADCLPDFAAS
jgi:hypothetical protein